MANGSKTYRRTEAMSDKTVQFHSGARNAGFTMVDNPVLRSRKLSASAKVVWGLMCFYARQDESCFPGQDRLAQEVPCSQRGLRNFIAELAGVGLIEVVRRGMGMTNVYVLHDIDGLATPAAGAGQDGHEVPPGSARGADQVGQQVPLPVTKTQRTKTQRTKTRQLPYPARVNGRAVADQEAHDAQAILAAWNAKAEQRLSARSWLEKIIRRMREHSELSLEDHKRIIERTLDGERWWTGDPDPALIYGNDAQFERCMLRTQRDSPGVSVQSEAEPARDWDAGLST